MAALPPLPSTLPSRRLWLQMGETPLIRSAHNGHYATVRFLVERGADVNALDIVRHCWQGEVAWHKRVW